MRIGRSSNLIAPMPGRDSELWRGWGSLTKRGGWESSKRRVTRVRRTRKNQQRLYRTLDQLLPHKVKLEAHLKNRLGELFDLEYDLLMYDITSTYFEGQANFDLAQRGYSRDQRSDCKQVGHRP